MTILTEVWIFQLNRSILRWIKRWMNREHLMGHYVRHDRIEVCEVVVEVVVLVRKGHRSLEQILTGVLGLSSRKDLELMRGHLMVQ